MQRSSILAILSIFAISSLAPVAMLTAAATQDSAELLIVEPPLQPVRTWAYSPVEQTVKLGTKLIWHNTGAVVHTVSADDGKTFESGNIPRNSTFGFTPTTPGTFHYHCKYHVWMKATIVVVP
jgi:plastocyanin